MAFLESVPPIPFGMPIVDPRTGEATQAFAIWWKQVNSNQGTLDTAKVETETSVIAGAGLNGGGDLSADVTLTADEQAILDAIGATRGSILYRGASGWAILSPGTSGHFLKSNGTGADPSYAAPSGGGSGFGLIDSDTFTTASTVDIDLPDGYTTFHLEYYLTTSATADIYYRITDDGFSTVKSGASDYAYALYRYAGTFGGDRDGAHTEIRTIGAVALPSSAFASAVVDIIHAKETTCPSRVRFETNYYTAGTPNVPNVTNGFGDFIGANDAIDGIRIFPSTGTITGLWRLYGV